MATTIITKFGSGAPAASDVVRGELAVDTENKRLYTENSGGSVVELGTNPAANITFGDNIKAIFGAGSDLQIFHDGSNSFINDAGTGDLTIKASNNLYLMSGSSELYAKFTTDGAATLYHDNSAKLATTSTGIDVTGTITADGLDLGDASVLNVGTIALDTIKGDADDNTNITFAGSDTTTFTQGGTQRLAVNTLGINVTGTVTADGLTVDGTAQFNTGAAGIAEFYHTSGYGGIKATGSASGSGATIYLSNDKTGTPFDIYTIFADGSDDSLQFWSGGNPSSGTKRFNAASNGDISFYEDTGTTAKLFWDASAESLGIGTTTPEHLLHIEGTSDSLFRLTRTGVRSFRQYINSSGNFIIRDLSGTPADRLTIDTSGQVGIGTTSPGRLLEVNTDGEAFIRIRSSDSGNAGLEFGDQSDSVQGAIFMNASDNSLRFNGFDNAERMRIDSSGNLLVGKSGAGSSNVGVELRQAGYIFGTGDGINPLRLNRKTSDGMIADFQKDGTSVGSISSTDNAGIIIGSHDVGLRFRQQSAGAAVFPRQPDGSALDATLDLGISNSRFKDLHLSGTAKVGAAVEIKGAAAASISEGLLIDYSTNLARFLTYDSSTGSEIAFYTQPSGGSTTERVRIDSTGEITFKANAGSVSHVFAYNEDGGEIKLADNTGATGTLIDQSLNSTRVLELINGSNLALGLGSSNTTGNILFYKAGFSEAMRIDSSGNLMVGTTSVDDSNDAQIGNHFAYPKTGMEFKSNSALAHFAATFRNTNGLVGSISTTGSATAFNTSSDQRLKDNIVDAPSASDDIDAIQVRSFDWKADGSHQKYGMVAQELVTVAPSAVSEPEDPEEMMSVDYSKLVPMMLKEIQQLRARVAQLEGAN